MTHEQLPTAISLQDAVQRLRDFLAERDEISVVSAVRPQRDPVVHKVKAQCVGTRSQECPVKWRGIYYKRQRGNLPVRTWIVI